VRASNAHRITVREATHEDIASIVTLGSSTATFAVSDSIRFYEAYELREWIEDPVHNVLLTVLPDDVVGGFAYCKLMSSHWALLDNFYCTAAAASNGAGLELFHALQTRLRSTGHAYLTTLVRSDHTTLMRLCQRLGFSKRDDYRWMDLTL